MSRIRLILEDKQGNPICDETHRGSDERIPYLAPELQFLFKANSA